MKGNLKKLASSLWPGLGGAREALEFAAAHRASRRVLVLLCVGETHTGFL